MALAKVLMKNLRNVLQFNKTLIIFTIFIFIYFFINSKINYKSKYNGNETSITGIITNIKIKSDYLELELKAKEKILAYYKYESITDVNIGDKVITSKYAGTEVKLDSEEYTIVRQSDILAIVE